MSRTFASRRRLALLGGLALIAAGCLPTIAFGQAQLAPREPRSAAVRPEPARPPAPAVRYQAPPKVVAPVFPTGQAAGLCQCISDYTRRNLSCLAGPAACQSVCGTTNYSLVPDAAFTCPLAPGEQLERPERLTQ